MNFTGYGKITFYNCAETRFSPNYYSLFSENDDAYLKNKALKGKIERVVIKKIYKKQISSVNNVIFIYQDTLNFFYEENDLISYEDALDLKNTYIQNHRVEKLKKICYNSSI